MYVGSSLMFSQTEVSVFPEEYVRKCELFVLFYFSDKLLVQVRLDYNELAVEKVTSKFCTVQQSRLTENRRV